MEGRNICFIPFLFAIPVIEVVISPYRHILSKFVEFLVEIDCFHNFNLPKLRVNELSECSIHDYYLYKL